MLFLTDQLTDNGLLLLHSLQCVERDVTGISISYNGYLPRGFQSPFAFFMDEDTDADPAPLFFNEVPVPAYWQIRGTGTSAEVWDYEHLRARIFYAQPLYRRHVRVVDWLDENGAVRSCDYYNQYGRRMAQVIMDGNGHNITKTWYNRQGRMVIYENYPAGEILLEDHRTDGGRTHAFHSLWEFTEYYLLRSGLDLSRIAYNSLSDPFFAARHLWTDHGVPGQDLLFWQEGIGADLPGNMKLLLREAKEAKKAGEQQTNSAGPRARKIIVQSREVYEKILQRDPAHRDLLACAGYIYPFASAAAKEQGQGAKDILILTNSDQIEGLKPLVEALPDFTFHIGALTEMSSKLLLFSHYPNVDLRPNIAFTSAGRLQRACGIYLDINHGDEILDSVRTAFLGEIPILVFDNTVHHREWTAPENIYPHDAAGVQQMVQAVRECASDAGRRRERIRLQETAGMAETEETYRRILA